MRCRRAKNDLTKPLSAHIEGTRVAIDLNVSHTVWRQIVCKGVLNPQQYHGKYNCPFLGKGSERPHAHDAFTVVGTLRDPIAVSMSDLEGLRAK